MSSHIESAMLNRTDYNPFVNPPKRSEDASTIRVSYLNLLTKFLTDPEPPRPPAKYPQYCWDKRLKPMLELIKIINPDILNYSECNLPQIIDLKKHLEKEYEFVGFSTECRTSIEETEKMIQDVGDKPLIYGGFNGCLIRRTDFDIIESKCHELPRGARHGRILVEVELVHRATQKHFVIFASHFDHLSLESRQLSGKFELERIAARQKEGKPCISLFDKNWHDLDKDGNYDPSGQECYEDYLKQGLKDIRDNKEYHYGPFGTFLGHLGLDPKFQPKIDSVSCSEDSVHEFLKIIRAKTFDVGFTTPDVEVLQSFCDYGAFETGSGRLMSNEELERPEINHEIVDNKSFISDHALLGADVRLF